MLSENYNQITLADKYGFSKKGIHDRLALFDLLDSQAADESLANLLQVEVISPACEEIIRQFYEYIWQFEEVRTYIKDDKTLEKLRITQCEYLKSLAVNYHQAEYFEYRLRIGIAHDRVGMPLHLYQAAYTKLQQLILDAIPDSISNDIERFIKLCHFVQRIVALDMSLAIDAYYLSRVNKMNESIEYLTQERGILKEKVEHDALTDSYSRTYIISVLKRLMQNLHSNPDARFSIAILDLDKFKFINDSYGHLAGDHVLKGFVKRVNSRIRNVDRLARFGGEEFVLVLPNTSQEGAQEISERIRQHIAESPFKVQGHNIDITVSIGVSESRASDVNDNLKAAIDEIINRADSALYEAKNTGRNQVIVK